MSNINWTNVWSMIAVYVWILGAILAPITLLVLTYLMAQKDFLIGFVPSGQIKVVMTGDSVHKWLVNVGGYIYQPETREIVEARKVPHPWRPFGLYWIGLPPFKRVLTYQFSWVKWDKKEGAQEFALIPRDRETVNSLFFRYPYGIELKKIMVKGNIEVNIVLVVTIEIVRPETTLFRIQPTGNWLGLVMAKVTEAVRGWAGEKGVDIEKLRALKAREKGAEDDLRTRVTDMNGEPTDTAVEAPDGLLRLCGVKIISVEFQNWEFADPEQGKAFRSKEVESQTAEGVKAKAEGEASKITQIGEAEAAVIQKKLAAAEHNPGLAARLAEAEALRETKVRVLSLGGAKEPLQTVPVDGPTAVATDETP